ncbi:bifunctional serine/threonine-protein kinase/ABC transporter substrate-binding protein [Gloeothece verrucosa]|uniref:non-specific serine/threonine protein kinase n=1 Tax=Gloeothece verrucosa (strain PCC 7822) TaxID=497965 RepID=E0U8M2_GLOV7|nr:bifunctional serine/threonine-protein kinase/ABC transporter substrate-binding protein [Gloeothece verrucosa]ADN13768.1 serine/threonine protein kinase [Gloeothece verrucosa PCC 7822]
MVQLPTKMPLNPGDIIRNRYQVLRFLGKGGFGITYLVEDLDCLNQERVLKQLTDPDATLEARELFQREAKLLEQLGTEHSQIPQIFAYFEENGIYYLVQEYIQGHCLNEELTNPCYEQTVINFLEDLLSILQYIHQQGVIHRDIKPSNLIRRSSDNKIVLIDFGAATVRRNSNQITRTLALGTPGYAPAEQFMGYPQLCSDIYAVGVIAIQVLIKSNPTQEQWELDAAHRHFIWRNKAQVREDLADIIDKMTAYHCQERYRSVQDVLEALRVLSRQDKPVVIPPPPPLPPDPPNYWKLKVALSVGLGVIVLGGWLVWSTQKSSFCPVQESDFISCAGVIINDDSPSSAKENGVEAYEKGNYIQALDFFENARKEQPRDPETLIYLNNVQLILNKTPVYSIAVSLPLKDRNNGSDAGLEILRGVAQAQKYINENNIIKGYGLQVVITDDDNKPARAITIANTLGKVPNILGVIGSYASDVTKASVSVYDQHQLVLISPTSTSEDLTDSSRFFFRTVSPDQNKAEKVAKFLIQKDIQKIAVFYNPDSSFSRSYKNNFEKSFAGRSIQVFDNLKNENFDAYQAIKEVRTQGSQALFLIPDGRVNDFSFNNALDLMRANDNKLPIIGSDTLFNPATRNQRKFAQGIVIAIPWHPLTSSDPDFTKEAEKEWKGTVSWRTAMAYDATITLAQALNKIPSPNWMESLMMIFNPKQKRLQLQQTLIDPNFKAKGVTAPEISFIKGDRQENTVQLVTLISNPCSSGEYDFVPVEKVNKIDLLHNCPQINADERR